MSCLNAYYEDRYRRIQQNDPIVMHYDHFYTELVTWQELVDTLWNNKYVCSLSLHFDSGPSNESDAKPLLDYLRDTTRLRQIYIHNSKRLQTSPGLQRLIGSILKSIALNRYIDSLSLSGGYDIKCEPFYSLMTSRSSKLSSLRLDINCFNGTTTPASPYNDVFTQSIGSNCNLQSLTIYVGKESDPAEIHSLLYHLGSHRTLNSLKIGSFYGFIPALPLDPQEVLEIVKSLSVLMQVTKSLCHLTIENFDMTKEGLEYLTYGLTLWASRQTLTLNGCTLDWDTTQWLLPLLQNESRCTFNLGLEINKSVALDKVQFPCYGATITFGNEARMQISRNSESLHQVQEVTLLVRPTTLARALDEINALVTTNVAQMRFQHINFVDEGSTKDRNVLYARIPNLYNLQTLSLWKTPLEQLDWPFVMAVRRSGSLTSVIGPSEFRLELFGTAKTLDTAKVLGTENTSLVKAYCARNKYVPKLLSQASLGQASLRQASHPSTVDVLVPLLFSVVKQAPTTAPNTILCGLLEM